MNTISYNICGDGYDADVRAGEIFEKAKKLIDKAYKKGRADERAKVLNDVHKAMAYKYHCKKDMCEFGMTCADCLKAYMEDLYSNK